jgi:membrane fusion protein (multidrug efflux system)
MPPTASATHSGVAARDATTGTRSGLGLRSVLRPLLMIGGIAVVIVGSGAWWLNGGRYVAIDDAYVRAAKVAVSTDVSGIVQSVAVKEGQHVQQGDLLLALDPAQFRIALEGAKANLAQTELAISASKRDYQRMLRDVAVKQAQMQSDQSTLDRLANLVKGGGVTRQDYDDSRFKLVADQQGVEALQAQAAAQLARLSGNPDIDPAQTPDVKAAQARVDEAQRQLDHAVIRAPFAGIVTQVDATQPGMYLAASTAAFGLVSEDHVWVDANPKETELTWVKPGDPVTLLVDTYPGRSWNAVVDSISPASGSEFSMIPAQNSSGNWVKVVQRIPLRVRIDRAAGDPPLRSGMSVEVTIDTGHSRRLADLF